MTAATIPRTNAAELPVLMGASLLGAKVAEAEEEAVWELALCVLVMSPNVTVLLEDLEEEEEVRVAVLKVEFLFIAVPVPEALAMLVMVMFMVLLFETALVVVAMVPLVALVTLDEEELPSTEKRPE